MKTLYRGQAVINKRDTVYLRRYSTPFTVDVCHKDGTFTVVDMHGQKQRVTIDDIDRIGERGDIRLTSYQIRPKVRVCNMQLR